MTQHQGSAALDRIEIVLESGDGSFTRDEQGICVNTSIGPAYIIATTAPQTGKAPLLEAVRGEIVRVATPIPRELRGFAAKMAPMLNRFATLGALTSMGDEVLVVSRASVLDNGSNDDLIPRLLGTAARKAGEALIQAASKVMQGDGVPSPTAPTLSPWGPRDFEPIQHMFLNKNGFASAIEKEHFSAWRNGEHGGHPQYFLQADWTIPHPVYGAGLLFSVEVDVGLEDRGQLAVLADHMNQQEAQAHHHLPHLGAWCIGRAEGALGYVTFLDGELRVEGIERSFASWGISRAVVARSYIQEYLS